MRSNTGIPFREVVITSDGNHLVVPAAEKGNRDCVMVYNAKTGVNISKIPIKLPGFKVFYSTDHYSILLQKHIVCIDFYLFRISWVLYQCQVKGHGLVLLALIRAAF